MSLECFFQLCSSLGTLPRVNLRSDFVLRGTLTNCGSFVLVLLLKDGSLAFDVGDDLLVEDTATAAHLLREGLGRSPLGGGSRSGLFHHSVNLLQGKTLGLRDEDEGVDKGAGAKTTPDEEDGRLQVASILVNHVRGDDGDDL